MAKQGPELLDSRLAKAVEHPIRIDILEILWKGPSSPARIQRQLKNVSLNLVSYHMKVLKELDFVELMETVTRRGVREHVYRSKGPLVFSDEEWDALAPEVRQRISIEGLRKISEDLAESLGTSLFYEVTDTHVSRLPLQLDERGWSEMVDLLSRTLTTAIEIGDKSTDRITANKVASTSVTVAIMQFPTPKQ